MKQTNKWFALALILTAPLLTIVDVYIINMAIPAIKNQYQTVDSLTELVISAYLVGYCVFLITGSRMGDYYGRKKIFLFGMLGFTLTSALCGWANTIFWGAQYFFDDVFHSMATIFGFRCASSQSLLYF